MSERIYTATASELMTKKPKGPSENKLAGEVHDWMNSNKYTAAPVYSSTADEPIGYVEQDRIEDRNLTIRTYIESFGLSNIISTGADFEEVIQALRRRYFFFLGGADQLTGILTRADLNKSSTYIHLYERITYIEELLRNRLMRWEDDWKSYLNEGAIGSIKGRIDSKSGLNLDLLYYSNFSHLITVIYKSNLYIELGFESEETAKSSLERLNRLRNDVTHRKPILEIEQIESGSSARDIADLSDTYSDLLEIMEELEKISSSDIIQRDVNAIRELLQLYEGTCQICGDVDTDNYGHSTVEAAHILPLSKGGPDITANILVMCPHHHHQFDRGSLRINPEQLIVEKSPNSKYEDEHIILKGNHKIEAKYLREHNRLIN